MLTCTICGVVFECDGYRKDTALYCSNRCRGIGISNNAKRRIEQEHSTPLPQLLRRLYVDERLSTRKIVALLGIGNHTLLDWLDEYGIEKRHGSEAVATQWEGNQKRRQDTADKMREMQANGTIDNFGDNNPSRNPDVIRRLSEMRKGAGNPMYNKLGPQNPAWKGGKVKDRGAGWRSTRTYIIRRDGNKCRRCGATEQLQVHHIIPYRETQDNSPRNLVTLCIHCHAAVEHGGADLIAEKVIHPGKDTYKLDRPIQLSLLMTPLHDLG